MSGSSRGEINWAVRLGWRSPSFFRYSHTQASSSPTGATWYTVTGRFRPLSNSSIRWVGVVTCWGVRSSTPTQAGTQASARAAAAHSAAPFSPRFQPPRPIGYSSSAPRARQ